VKRVGHLFEKIISRENLKQAIETVCSSHRWVLYPRKMNSTVLWIEEDIEARIDELQSILVNGYKPSPVTLKRRYDVNAGKWRDIAEPRLWPDQCIHHALIQITEPVMMRGMDNWCCGSIKNRGAHYGIRGIKKWMLNEKETAWCLEMDIYHFYESIDPQELMNRMKKLIKDYKALDLIERITKNGIQIGAYCSQWFANTFLQELDQLIRNLGATRSIRYMDNFTVFTKNKKDATIILEATKQWLKEHKLSMKNNWQKFNASIRMPNALGYRFGRGYTLLRKKNLLRLNHCLKRFYRRYESGKFITTRFAQGLISRLGMLRHCSSVNIYYRFVKPKVQKKLKDIVRNYYRKEIEKWSTFLELSSATV